MMSITTVTTITMMITVTLTIIIVFTTRQVNRQADPTAVFKDSIGFLPLPLMTSQEHTISSQVLSSNILFRY